MPLGDLCSSRFHSFVVVSKKKDQNYDISTLDRFHLHIFNDEK
jgi:hypothetical protein